MNKKRSPGGRRLDGTPDLHRACLRPPKGHALWKFENVIITPHIAGRSDQDAGRMMGTIKENVRRFVAGKPLINVVDKQKGY